ncbi:MAG: hypothetical protein D6709_03760 [Chloroflexi bacterium]|uniref:DUF3137 domain-containing protein n=2 Tax=Candidatus Thermofonsia Clade 3 TaxID=2364209 RepID=A0A2M8QDY6_9CHLR|nr:MAG: hypothetical protein CUN48_05775 [Candidatus Thermofonsia Clade 3 bacterium]RMG65085.1 MAG: hypothetical protein D6709_03760 [Chloroflexota bacterium]
MKGAGWLIFLLGSAGSLLWLWRRNAAENQHMAEMLGLSPVQDAAWEDVDEPARGVALRTQRPILRGSIRGYTATVWQRGYYLQQNDSRFYLRTPFYTLAFELPAPAPVRLTFEPTGLQEDVPPLASLWPVVRAGDPDFDASVRVTSPQPTEAGASLSSELRRAAMDFFARFACDNPTDYPFDVRRAVLGWLEVEDSQVTYTTFSVPEKLSACARRMQCALPLMDALAQAAMSV